MMKKIILVTCFMMSTFIFAADSIDTQLKNLENQLEVLERQEAQKRAQMAEEKKVLETELAGLQDKLAANAKIKAKLSGDAMIRWHKNEYNQLLNETEAYEKTLTDAIKMKEQKISNIESLLSVM